MGGLLSKIDFRKNIVSECGLNTLYGSLAFSFLIKVELIGLANRKF